MIAMVSRQVPVFTSYAAERARGLYNVDAADGANFELRVEIPTEKGDWQIGLVVGPSGSGKSSVLRELAATERWIEWKGGRWSKSDPIIEVLGAKDFAKATAALSAVGLGSVPSWLRPKHVLSTGEQFRAEMAQMLLRTSEKSRMLVDEFTSVLDRQVAQVASGAFAKSWRRTPGRQVILFTCHYDVLEWIQPDWWIDTAEGLDQFAADRGVVRAREGSFPAAADRHGYSGNRLGTVEC
jgi:ABC-type ATPase with predicted acetyltransferase domain